MKYLDEDLIGRYEGKICDYVKNQDFDSAKRLTKKLILWIIDDGESKLVFELVNLLSWAGSYFAYENEYKQNETEEFLQFLQEILKSGHRFSGETEFLICVAQILRDNGREYRDYVDKAIKKSDNSIKLNPADMVSYYKKMEAICCFLEIEDIKAQLQETYKDAQVMILEKNMDDDDHDEWYISAMGDMIDNPKGSFSFSRKFQPKEYCFGLR